MHHSLHCFQKCLHGRVRDAARYGVLLRVPASARPVVAPYGVLSEVPARGGGMPPPYRFYRECIRAGG